MRLRRNFVNATKGSMEKLSMLALAIRFKCVLKNSKLPHFSINKLATASGVSYKTVRKYLPKLKEAGFCHLEGTGKNQIFVVNSLSSKTSKLNFNITILKLDSFQNIRESLQAFLIMYLQSKKDYINHTLSSNSNPKRSENFKAVRRKIRNLVKLGYLNNVHQRYVENGLSLNRIAKEIGCSVVTALKAVNYAIENGWLERHKHYLQYYANGINHLPVEWATFTTKNNIYVILANTYTLTPLAVTCFPWLSKAA